jgi:hypothetical protein
VQTVWSGDGPIGAPSTTVSCPAPAATCFTSTSANCPLLLFQHHTNSQPTHQRPRTCLALVGDAHQLLCCAGSDGAALWVSDLVGHLLQAGQQLGEEGGCVQGVVHLSMGGAAADGVTAAGRKRQKV